MKRLTKVLSFLALCLAMVFAFTACSPSAINATDATNILSAGTEKLQTEIKELIESKKIGINLSVVSKNTVTIDGKKFNADINATVKATIDIETMTNSAALIEMKIPEMFIGGTATTPEQKATITYYWTNSVLYMHTKTSESEAKTKSDMPVENLLLLISNISNSGEIPGLGDPLANLGILGKLVVPGDNYSAETKNYINSIFDTNAFIGSLVTFSKFGTSGNEAIGINLNAASIKKSVSNALTEVDKMYDKLHTDAKNISDGDILSNYLLQVYDNNSIEASNFANQLKDEDGIISLKKEAKDIIEEFANSLPEKFEISLTIKLKKGMLSSIKSSYLANITIADKTSAIKGMTSIDFKLSSSVSVKAPSGLDLYEDAIL